MKTPLIFDIVRPSFVDGPGVRTTVFFKGCNLRCRWCHNPEGQSSLAEAAFFEEKCVGCGKCENICPSREECSLCHKCVYACVAGARKIYGKKMTPEEIYAVVARDKAFYDATGGGVTFSGGECMLFPEFLEECAALCAKGGINVAIDTAGCVPQADFQKIMRYADVFLYDIKCLTEKTHIEQTGQSNKLILENFEWLLANGANVIVRVPVIDAFNTGAEMERIKRYLSDKNVKIEYLPYHKMGESKRQALNKENFFKKDKKSH